MYHMSATAVLVLPATGSAVDMKKVADKAADPKGQPNAQ